MEFSLAMQYRPPCHGFTLKGRRPITVRQTLEPPSLLIRSKIHQSGTSLPISVTDNDEPILVSARKFIPLLQKAESPPLVKLRKQQTHWLILR